MASGYLARLYEPSDVLKVVALAPAGDGGRRSASEFRYQTVGLLSSSFCPVYKWAQERNASGWDVCVGVNPVRRLRDVTGRVGYGSSAGHVARFAYVQMDLDRDTHGALTKLRGDVVAGRLPSPSAVIRTSRGPNKYQLLWALRSSKWGVSDRPEDHARVVSVNRALVRRYGGDPAAVDTARLFRVPGFINRKSVYRERPVVVATGPVRRLEGLPPPGQATPADFQGLLAIAGPPRAAPVAPGVGPVASGRALPFLSARSTGHRSQSEADWMVVCSQLRAGRPADQIMCELASFRDTQARLGRLPAKSRPLYYAAHTVGRAARRLGMPGPSLSPQQASRVDLGELVSAVGAGAVRPPSASPLVASSPGRRRLGPPPIRSIVGR